VGCGADDRGRDVSCSHPFERDANFLQESGYFNLKSCIFFTLADLWTTGRKEVVDATLYFPFLHGISTCVFLILFRPDQLRCLLVVVLFSGNAFDLGFDVTK